MSDYEDRYGMELQVGDSVLCDGSEHGVITEFSGLGAYVCMESDGSEIDYYLDQLEYFEE